MELPALCPVVRLQFRSKFCHVRARKAHSDGQISRLTLSPFLSISLSPFKLPSSDHLAAAASSFSKERPALLHESIFLDSDSEILNEQSTTFVFLEENVDRLEEVLNEIEEEIVRGDIYPNAVVEAESKVFSLQKELSQLQTLLESKHNRLEASLDEIRALKSRLQDVEVQSGALTLYKEAQEAKQVDELSRLQSLSKGNLEVLEKHMFVNEAMNHSLERVQNVWECITRSNSSSMALKLIGILQREALHYFEALGIALKELEQEKIAANNILLKLQESSDNLKEKDMEINSLRYEVSRQIQKHEVLSKELANAGAEVSNLNKKLSTAENLLEKERKSLSAARDGLEKLDHALFNEESKVRDLFREVSSLKEQLEQKEEMVQSLTKEKLKYRGFQDLARKHLKEFHESERKVRELTANCNALENNIRFKDQLVEEMKKHAAERTEAMRIATEIKKDLNSCRHRELQLEQELEREKLQVKNLRWELMENSRAVKAEMALQQAEKDMLNLNKDLAILQEGIRSRDNVIKLLQENIDGNVHILKRASEDREKMRQMEEHIYRLESKLKEFL